MLHRSPGRLLNSSISSRRSKIIATPARLMPGVSLVAYLACPGRTLSYNKLKHKGFNNRQQEICAFFQQISGNHACFLSSSAVFCPIFLLTGPIWRFNDNFMLKQVGEKGILFFTDPIVEKAISYHLIYAEDGSHEKYEKFSVTPGIFIYDKSI